jgi:hypothetical protein
MANDWTVPAVELARGQTRGAVILLGDAGRRALAGQAAELLASGKRVFAIDPLCFGESAASDGPQQMLLLSAVGARALGIQASEVAAAARWLQTEHHCGPVRVVAVGPRSSVFALAAAGLEDNAISELELHQCLPSLKQVIEQNHLFDQEPELFCFGLLEAFDLEQLRALVVPRPVTFLE